MRYLISVIHDGLATPAGHEVVLKLAAEGSKACNRKIEVRPFL